MQTIETKHLGPTNFRGSRIKATHGAWSYPTESITMGYDHALNLDENHQKTAKALLDKLHAPAQGWKGKLVGGSTKSGMAWIFIDGSLEINSDLPITSGTNGRPLPFQI